MNARGPAPRAIDAPAVTASWLEPLYGLARVQPPLRPPSPAPSTWLFPLGARFTGWLLTLPALGLAVLAGQAAFDYVDSGPGYRHADDVERMAIAGGLGAVLFVTALVLWVGVPRLARRP